MLTGYKCKPVKKGWFRLSATIETFNDEGFFSRYARVDKPTRKPPPRPMKSLGQLEGGEVEGPPPYDRPEGSPPPPPKYDFVPADVDEYSASNAASSSAPLSNNVTTGVLN